MWKYEEGVALLKWRRNWWFCEKEWNRRETNKNWKEVFWAAMLENNEPTTNQSWCLFCEQKKKSNKIQETSEMQNSSFFIE